MAQTRSQVHLIAAASNGSRFQGMGRAVAMIMVLLLAPCSAWAWPRGYPGSTWGSLTRDLNAIEGNGIQGRLRQGILWGQWPGRINFISYASYEGRARTENRQYYNVHGLALGLELERGPLSLQMEYRWDDYPEWPLTTNSPDARLVGYKKWELADRLDSRSFLGIPVNGYPLIVWGQVGHDFGKANGAGTMGWINQGIEWFEWPRGVAFKTFAAYNWRLREKNRDYYNSFGPSLGAEWVSGPLSFGIEKAWKQFPGLDTRTNDFRMYLNWYLSWDLKRP